MSMSQEKSRNVPRLYRQRDCPCGFCAQEMGRVGRVQSQLSASGEEVYEIPEAPRAEALEADGFSGGSERYDGG